MIQHAAEGVTGILMRHAILDGLADGDGQTAGAVWIIRQNGSAGIGFRTRAGDALGTPGTHHDFTQRLLLETDLHHVDFAFQSEHLAGHRQ